MTTLGAAIGALCSGFIASIGRWNCLILANFVLVVGVLLTLISEFSVLCTGRFIYGLAIGSFNVFCPKYIAEVSPIEVKGPCGALSEISVAFGILVAFCVGLGIGEAEDDDIDSF